MEKNLYGEDNRYGAAAQALHWATAMLIAAAWTMGVIAADMPRGPDKGFWMGVHKSLGVMVVMLTFARAAWRLANPPPPLPDSTTPAMRLAAHGAHLALYALMILLPLSGVILSQANGRGVEFWGLFALPTLIQPDKELAGAMEEAHEVMANLILALIFTHAAAALFHQHILKDGLMERMIPHRRASKV